MSRSLLNNTVFDVPYVSFARRFGDSPKEQNSESVGDCFNVSIRLPRSGKVVGRERIFWCWTDAPAIFCAISMAFQLNWRSAYYFPSILIKNYIQLLITCW